jgi:hypothetical protein
MSIGAINSAWIYSFLVINWQVPVTAVIMGGGWNRGAIIHNEEGKVIRRTAQLCDEATKKNIKVTLASATVRAAECCKLPERTLKIIWKESKNHQTEILLSPSREQLINLKFSMWLQKLDITQFRTATRLRFGRSMNRGLIPGWADTSLLPKASRQALEEKPTSWLFLRCKAVGSWSWLHFHLSLSVALVRKRTIPTERPLLVSEVSANFCG